MQQPTFGEAVGGLAMLAALAVVAYIAVVGKSEVALGGLLAILSAGAGYFLRAKLSPPASVYTTRTRTRANNPQERGTHG